MEQQHSRKQFLRNMIVGATSLPLILQACSKESLTEDAAVAGDGGIGNSNAAAAPTVCRVTPPEMDGPFPLYNSRGSALVRTNINDGKTGVPLNIDFTVANVNTGCTPIPNARVDIWQCDKDGYYSGYINDGYLGRQNNIGRVFGRGIQYANSAGLVHFESIYPGWYPGRIAHIHVQIFINNALRLTTQIAFPDQINYAVYRTPLYAAHGQNSTVYNNQADALFADSIAFQLGTVVSNPQTGGYTLSHTIKISA
ncbi:dioxygenase family protein [Chitinophaga nivalis]|uniref:Intradiol ring-cleavage dioxygenases domain-containing protein n=1 Tax=Chitinophaga nivalis TaxID=2991709 RepID=A0ABT3IRR2_9BACT|nr:hypothetical protein [Chitinophaga nivalis]MCW3463911.1 hypothetical protein [Chitinophaga nivalis]MCW3486399.1 hypothetical protein [Chitinophaga nivalis]